MVMDEGVLFNRTACGMSIDMTSWRDFRVHQDRKRGPSVQMLRRGNHNNTEFWRRVLLSVIERYRFVGRVPPAATITINQRRVKPALPYFRGDGAPKAAGLPPRPVDRS
jgi:hypothetical protein